MIFPKIGSPKIISPKSVRPKNITNNPENNSHNGNLGELIGTHQKYFSYS